MKIDLMTKQAALDLMSSAKDIDDWNQKRELVQQSVSHEAWQELYRIIDQNGMCPKTLKKNRKVKRIVISEK